MSVPEAAPLRTAAPASASATRVEPRRPHLGWFALLGGGVASLVALAISKSLHRACARRLPLPSRRALQVLAAATAVVHVGEAAAAYRMARRAGLDDRASRTTQTLSIGFPALLATRKAAQTQAQAAPATDPT